MRAEFSTLTCPASAPRVCFQLHIVRQAFLPLDSLRILCYAALGSYLRRIVFGRQPRGIGIRGLRVSYLFVLPAASRVFRFLPFMQSAFFCSNAPWSADTKLIHSKGHFPNAESHSPGWAVALHAIDAAVRPPQAVYSALDKPGRIKQRRSFCLRNRSGIRH